MSENQFDPRNGWQSTELCLSSANTIHTAVRKAIAHSKKYDQNTHFTFTGTLVRCTPRSDQNGTVQAYFKVRSGTAQSDTVGPVLLFDPARS